MIMDVSFPVSADSPLIFSHHTIDELNEICYIGLSAVSICKQNAKE